MLLVFMLLTSLMLLALIMLLALELASRGWPVTCAVLSDHPAGVADQLAIVTQLLRP